MDDFVKESLLKWITLIIKTDVTDTDLRDGTVFTQLIDLSHYVPKVTDLGCVKDQITSFLDGTFQSNVSDLFDIDGVISGVSADLEVYGVCLTVLLGCLQSPCKQSFMDAALDLTLDMQTAIFHLIRGPMIHLSFHHEFTRELVINTLLNPFPGVQNDSLLIHHPDVCQTEDETGEQPPRALSSSDIPGCQKSVSTANKDRDLSVKTSDFEFLRPTSPSRHVSKQTNKTKDASSHQRPNDLSLFSTLDLNLSATSSRLNLADTPERNTNHGHHGIPQPASPLTSLKCLLDSPSLTHKTQLRESEREKRRLLAELEKERTCRDEAESLVAGLRSQVEKATLRATESESRALRLSRELKALHDQGDELAHCRNELALKEKEITSLKQRVNGFQDLMAHSRKLELEKIDLQQECEDLRLKVDQQLCQIREFKERRIKCSEIEELKSKLREVEAQLAQQLREREMIEKDTRQQSEMLSQLKLQYSMKKPHPCDTSNVINQSVCNVDEVECDVQIPASPLLNGNGLQNKESVLNNSCQDLSFFKPGENLGSVLEDDLKSARLFISKLQLQFDEELGSAKQLLEEKTKRLCELEHIISTRMALITMDVATQTEVFHASTNSDELLSPDLLQTLTVDACSASAADRRGLSDELVRLHEEIADSKSYARELEQELAEANEELRCTKDELIVQTTLCNRNQQNWIILEKEYRELQHQNRLLQNNLLSAEENLSRTEATPQSEEFEAARMNYEKEINLLNQQLVETTFECRRLEAERARVAERNSDLQRELETTRILVDSLKQNSESKSIDCHYSSSQPRRSAPVIGPLDHNHQHHHHRLYHQYNSVLSKNARVNHQRRLSDSLEDWEDSDHHDDDNEDFSQSHQIRSSIYPYEMKQPVNQPEHYSCAIVNHSSEAAYKPRSTMNGNKNNENLGYSKRKRHLSKLRTDSKHLSRLASRTQELEEYAIRLREQFDQQQSLTQMNSLIGVYPNIAEANNTTNMNGNNNYNNNDGNNNNNNNKHMMTAPSITGKSHQHTNGYTNEYVDNGDCYAVHEQDTDADSSAYTDLSQVSPVSQPVDSDPNRLKELHLRNRQQPSHLRSSYPVETQAIDSTDIVGTLSQITTDNNLSNKIKSRSHKGHHHYHHTKESSISNSANSQSTMYNTTANNNTSVSRLVPSALSNDPKHTSQIKSIQNRNNFESDSTPSPLAAGYQPLPKDIQSLGEALISASVDSKAMNYVLTTHPNLIKSVVSEKETTPCRSSYSLTTNGLQNGVHHALSSSERKIEYRNSVPEAFSNHNKIHNRYVETRNGRNSGGETSSDNENVNPPPPPPTSTAAMVNRRLTHSGLFVKPLNPVQNHRSKRVDAYSNQRNCVSPTNSVRSVDDLSGASSIRSSKSSIAFEIKNDHKSTVRRGPARLPSQINGKSGKSKKMNSGGAGGDRAMQRINCQPAFNESKLATATQIIPQRHITP
uniref:Uncharacterized protein n=1 Tax=Trichobilharzia regenti TaxID=157069 RepID=A0AA85IRH9_TRIRE|nr:unnamed protein product [Trichobilharzia regenti]CAH8854409.1 unnamed protein product [Trichobilharzia regenti]